ncbi:MAG: hypothetical protein ACXW3O_12605 [Brevundimonas sp.]
MPPELDAYAGCYAGEPGASAEVTAGDGGVAVRFGRGASARLELAAAAPDEFRRGAMVARFHRDAAGAVVGFSYSDPLLRRLRFMRRGERGD